MAVSGLCPVAEADGANFILTESVMNKKILAGVVAVSMLTLLSGCNEEAKPQKPEPQFGVVQVAKVYQESQLGKQGIARVGELENKAMATLKDLQDKLEKARAEKNEAEAQRLEKDLQARVYFLQNVIKQDQEHVMNVLQTEMKKAFDQCRADRNLFGLFSDDVVPSYSPEIDMTAAVKEILDAGKTGFGDLPSLEMPSLPEPENATPKDAGAAGQKSAQPAEAPAGK